MLACFVVALFDAMHLDNCTMTAYDGPMAPKRIDVNLSRFCDSTCAHCAREWFRWLKSREVQMNKPEEGLSVTFAAAAATSIRPA